MKSQISRSLPVLGALLFGVGSVFAQVSIRWDEIDKTGANLGEIPTRSFSSLQNIPTTLGAGGYGVTNGAVLDSFAAAQSGAVQNVGTGASPEFAGISVSGNANGDLDPVLPTHFANKRYVDAKQAFVNVKDYGALGNGSADDTFAISTAIAAVSNGVVIFPSGTYRTTSRIDIDTSKCGLVGYGAVIDASASSNGAIRVFSTADGTTREALNLAHTISGMVFKAASTATNTQVGETGAGFYSSSEITFRDCSFIGGATGILIAANGWRAIFEKCNVSRITSYVVDHNSPGNAGELIEFLHCWFDSNGVAIWRINDGSFTFRGCSMPAAGSGKFDIYGSASAAFYACNFETQGPVDSPIVTVRQSGVAVLDACVMLFNAAVNVAPFEANDAGSLTFSASTLYLYGANLVSESNSGVRCLVGGNSRYVKSIGNYIKSTGLTTRADLYGVFSAQNNLLANGDAEGGNTNGWTVIAYGTTTTGTMTAVSTAPKVGLKCFNITAPANGGVECQGKVSCAGMVGRTVVLGFWVKVGTGSAFVDFPAIRFRDIAGNVIGSQNVTSVASTTTTWTWYAMAAAVPPGASYVEAVIGAQQATDSSTIFYDGVTLNIL